MKKFFTYLAFFIATVYFVGCENEKFTKETELSSLEGNALNDYPLTKGKPNLYYWSQGKKVPLSIDPYTVIISSESDSIYLRQALASQVGRNAVISKLSDGLFAVRSKNDLSDFERYTEGISTINNVFPSYRYGESFEMVPTGEILLELKQNNSIQDLLSEFDGEVELVKAKKRNCFTIRVINFTDVLSIANSIYEGKMVEWCHPDFIVPIKRASNDTYFSQQYYLNQANNIDINAPEAWALLGATPNPVRVAVIDDGVESHSELTGRVLQGFTPQNSTGYGAPNTSTDGHGQAVSGIIGATRDNSSIIAGVASGVDIIPVNIFYGGESVQDIADAINWAWDDGDADILNNSWGFAGTPPGFQVIVDAITDAVNLGRGGKGTIVAFASGNSYPSVNGVAFPANVNNVIAVGAINRYGSIWGYSQRGPEMDLVAPSGNINLTGDVYTIDRTGSNGYSSGNYLTSFGGTSAACPQVVGVAALMLMANANLTEVEVRTKLHETAIDMGTAGFDNTFGFGRVDAENAVRSALCNGIDKKLINGTCETGVWQCIDSEFIRMEGNFRVYKNTFAYVFSDGSHAGDVTEESFFQCAL